MHRWIILLGACILMNSCSFGEKKHPIPRKDLVPLLVDLHVADALALNTTISDQFGRLDSALLYSNVMNRYGYTKDDLFTTLNYYTDKPEALMEIYDEVFALLSAQSEEVKAAYNKYSSQNTKHVWRPVKNRIGVEGDTVRYPVFDSILIDSMGTYVLSLSIKLNEKDESVNPRLEAYFYNPQYDIPESRLYFDKVDLHKSRYARELMLVKEVNDTSLSLLRITPVVFDNKDSSFYKSLDMYSVRLGILKSDPKKIQDR